MDNVRISIRTSHAYVDEYADLDGHEYIGTVRMTPAKLVSEGDGIEHRGTYVRFTRLPRDMDTQKAMRALVDTFGHWGCACEHDCCGCPLVRASAELVKRRTVKLTLDVSSNY